jgi:hypothetical protein
MAQQTINVNGNPQVFNNVILSINGDSQGVPLNGYIKNVRWSTGTQTDHVRTLNPLAEPITTNSITSSPQGSITFVAGAFGTFYQFLNNRFTKFTLQFIQYTTGDLGGETQTLVIKNAQLDDLSGSSDEGSAANMNTIGFKSVFCGYL